MGLSPGDKRRRRSSDVRSKKARLMRRIRKIVEKSISKKSRKRTRSPTSSSASSSSTSSSSSSTLSTMSSSSSTSNSDSSSTSSSTEKENRRRSRRRDRRRSRRSVSQRSRSRERSRKNGGSRLARSRSRCDSRSRSSIESIVKKSKGKKVSRDPRKRRKIDETTDRKFGQSVNIEVARSTDDAGFKDADARISRVERETSTSKVRASVENENSLGTTAESHLKNFRHTMDSQEASDSQEANVNKQETFVKNDSKEIENSLGATVESRLKNFRDPTDSPMMNVEASCSRNSLSRSDDNTERRIERVSQDKQETSTNDLKENENSPVANVESWLKNSRDATMASQVENIKVSQKTNVEASQNISLCLSRSINQQGNFDADSSDAGRVSPRCKKRKTTGKSGSKEIDPHDANVESQLENFTSDSTESTSEFGKSDAESIDNKDDEGQKRRALHQDNKQETLGKKVEGTSKSSPELGYSDAVKRIMRVIKRREKSKRRKERKVARKIDASRLSTSEINNNGDVEKNTSKMTRRKNEKLLGSVDDEIVTDKMQNAMEIDVERSASSGKKFDEKSPSSFSKENGDRVDGKSREWSDGFEENNPKGTGRSFLDEIHANQAENSFSGNDEGDTNFTENLVEVVSENDGFREEIVEKSATSPVKENFVRKLNEDRREKEDGRISFHIVGSRTKSEYGKIADEGKETRTRSEEDKSGEESSQEILDIHVSLEDSEFRDSGDDDEQNQDENSEKIVRKSQETFAENEQNLMKSEILKENQEKLEKCGKIENSASVEEIRDENSEKLVEKIARKSPEMLTESNENLLKPEILKEIEEKLENCGKPEKSATMEENAEKIARKPEETLIVSDDNLMEPEIPKETEEKLENCGKTEKSVTVEKNRDENSEKTAESDDEDFVNSTTIDEDKVERNHQKIVEEMTRKSAGMIPETSSSSEDEDCADHEEDSSSVGLQDKKIVTTALRPIVMLERLKCGHFNRVESKEKDRETDTTKDSKVAESIEDQRAYCGESEKKMSENKPATSTLQKIDTDFQKIARNPLENRENSDVQSNSQEKSAEKSQQLLAVDEIFAKADQTFQVGTTENRAENEQPVIPEFSENLSNDAPAQETEKSTVIEPQMNLENIAGVAEAFERRENVEKIVESKSVNSALRKVDADFQELAKNPQKVILATAVQRFEAGTTANRAENEPPMILELSENSSKDVLPTQETKNDTVTEPMQVDMNAGVADAIEGATENREIAEKIAENREIAEKIAENREIAEKIAENREIAEKIAENREIAENMPETSTAKITDRKRKISLPKSIRDPVEKFWMLVAVEAILTKAAKTFETTTRKNRVDKEPNFPRETKNLVEKEISAADESPAESAMGFPSRETDDDESAKDGSQESENLSEKKSLIGPKFPEEPLTVFSPRETESNNDKEPTASFESPKDIFSQQDENSAEKNLPRVSEFPDESSQDFTSRDIQSFAEIETPKASESPGEKTPNKSENSAEKNLSVVSEFPKESSEDFTSRETQSFAEIETPKAPESLGEITPEKSENSAEKNLSVSEFPEEPSDDFTSREIQSIAEIETPKAPESPGEITPKKSENTAEKNLSVVSEFPEESSDDFTSREIQSIAEIETPKAPESPEEIRPEESENSAEKNSSVVSEFPDESSEGFTSRKIQSFVEIETPKALESPGEITRPKSDNRGEKEATMSLELPEETSKCFPSRETEIFADNEESTASEPSEESLPRASEKFDETDSQMVSELPGESSTNFSSREMKKIAGNAAAAAALESPVKMSARETENLIEEEPSATPELSEESLENVPSQEVEHVGLKDKVSPEKMANLSAKKPPPVASKFPEESSTDYSAQKSTNTPIIESNMEIDVFAVEDQTETAKNSAEQNETTKKSFPKGILPLMQEIFGIEAENSPSTSATHGPEEPAKLDARLKSEIVAKYRSAIPASRFPIRTPRDNLRRTRSAELLPKSAKEICEIVPPIDTAIANDRRQTKSAGLLPESAKKIGEIGEIGPPIDAAIANDWSSIMRQGLPMGVKENLLARYKPAGNCPELRTPRLNPSFQCLMSANFVRKDRQFMDSQNQLAAAISALGKVLTTVQDGKSVAPETLGTLDEAARILANLHRENYVARRSHITTGIGNFVESIAGENAVDDFLFRSASNENSGAIEPRRSDEKSAASREDIEKSLGADDDRIILRVEEPTTEVEENRRNEISGVTETTEVRTASTGDDSNEGQIGTDNEKIGDARKSEREICQSVNEVENSRDGKSAPNPRAKDSRDPESSMPEEVTGISATSSETDRACSTGKSAKEEIRSSPNVSENSFRTEILETMEFVISAIETVDRKIGITEESSRLKIGNVKSESARATVETSAQKPQPEVTGEAGKSATSIEEMKIIVKQFFKSAKVSRDSEGRFTEENPQQQTSEIQLSTSQRVPELPTWSPSQSEHPGESFGGSSSSGSSEIPRNSMIPVISSEASIVLGPTTLRRDVECPASIPARAKPQQEKTSWRLKPLPASNTVRKPRKFVSLPDPTSATNVRPPPPSANNSGSSSIRPSLPLAEPSISQPSNSAYSLRPLEFPGPLKNLQPMNSEPQFRPPESLKPQPTNSVPQFEPPRPLTSQSTDSLPLFRSPRPPGPPKSSQPSNSRPSVRSPKSSKSPDSSSSSPDCQSKIRQSSFRSPRSLGCLTSRPKKGSPGSLNSQPTNLGLRVRPLSTCSGPWRLSESSSSSSSSSSGPLRRPRTWSHHHQPPPPRIDPNSVVIVRPGILVSRSTSARPARPGNWSSQASIDSSLSPETFIKEEKQLEMEIRFGSVNDESAAPQMSQRQRVNSGSMRRECQRKPDELNSSRNRQRAQLPVAAGPSQLFLATSSQSSTENQQKSPQDSVAGRCLPLPVAKSSQSSRKNQQKPPQDSVAGRFSTCVTSSSQASPGNQQRLVLDSAAVRPDFSVTSSQLSRANQTQRLSQVSMAGKFLSCVTTTQSSLANQQRSQDSVTGRCSIGIITSQSVPANQQRSQDSVPGRCSISVTTSQSSPANQQRSQDSLLSVILSDAAKIQHNEAAKSACLTSSQSSREKQPRRGVSSPSSIASVAAEKPISETEKLKIANSSLQKPGKSGNEDFAAKKPIVLIEKLKTTNSSLEKPEKLNYHNFAAKKPNSEAEKLKTANSSLQKPEKSDYEDFAAKKPNSEAEKLKTANSSLQKPGKSGNEDFAVPRIGGKRSRQDIEMEPLEIERFKVARDSATDVKRASGAGNKIETSREEVSKVSGDSTTVTKLASSEIKIKMETLRIDQISVALQSSGESELDKIENYDLTYLDDDDDVIEIVAIERSLVSSSSSKDAKKPSSSGRIEKSASENFSAAKSSDEVGESSDTEIAADSGKSEKPKKGRRSFLDWFEERQRISGVQGERISPYLQTKSRSSRRSNRPSTSDASDDRTMNINAMANDEIWIPMDEGVEMMVPTVTEINQRSVSPAADETRAANSRNSRNSRLTTTATTEIQRRAPENLDEDSPHEKR